MRTRWVRTALVAACALAYLVVWAGTAEAATPRQLLHRYQPVTVLDPLEQFAPTEVNGFVDDSVLEIQTAPGVWSVAQANPTLATLPTQPAQSCIDAGLADSCYRLNQAACSPADGTAGVACYSNAEQAGDPRSVVYGRVVAQDDRTVLAVLVLLLRRCLLVRLSAEQLHLAGARGQLGGRERRSLGRETEQPFFVGIQPALPWRTTVVR